MNWSGSLWEIGLSRRWQTSTPAGREALYREIHALMMQVDPVSREEWLMQLRKWARAGEKCVGTNLP